MMTMRSILFLSKGEVTIFNPYAFDSYNLDIDNVSNLRYRVKAFISYKLKTTALSIVLSQSRRENYYANTPRHIVIHVRYLPEQ